MHILALSAVGHFNGYTRRGFRGFSVPRRAAFRLEAAWFEILSPTREHARSHLTATLHRRRCGKMTLKLITATPRSCLMKQQRDDVAAALWRDGVEGKVEVPSCVVQRSVIGSGRVAPICHSPMCAQTMFGMHKTKAIRPVPLGLPSTLCGVPTRSIFPRAVN